jgi:hypothetical protein
MLGAGAICGGCDERCCPDTERVSGKMDMCINDNTINVSENACPGLLNAGATCGPCAEVEVTKAKKSTVKKPAAKE